MVKLENWWKERLGLMKEDKAFYVGMWPIFAFIGSPQHIEKTEDLVRISTYVDYGKFGIRCDFPVNSAFNPTSSKLVVIFPYYLVPKLDNQWN